MNFKATAVFPCKDFSNPPYSISITDDEGNRCGFVLKTDGTRKIWRTKRAAEVKAEYLSLADLTPRNIAIACAFSRLAKKSN